MSAAATRLVILGKQGAGKGTQCELLVSRYGLTHISTGDMLRAAVAAGTPLGQEAEAVMASGELVSDDLILRIVEQRLAQPDAQAGFLLDGFPRTQPQADGLYGLLDADGLTAAIDLDVPDAVVTQRMAGRGREDDTPDAIARRLALYEKETAPLRQSFASNTRLLTIDGLGTPEQVHQRICSHLDALLART